MKRITPLTGIALVLLVAVAVWTADYAISGGFDAGHIRVSPDRQGTVAIDVGDLQNLQVRFYRFLNSGNQEVKFLVGRDEKGEILVAFDASESDFKRKRGFRHQGEWLVNNKCESSVRLHEVNAGRGGCAPVPVSHRVVGQQVVLQETDILVGWRYFR